MSIEEITENVYVIYPGASPRKLSDYEYYRGNSFSITLIGKNGDETPFNFDVYENFWMQFRKRPEPNQELVAEFGPENFLLGQTQDAIDYDVTQGNPVGFTKDELHLYDSTGDILKPEEAYVGKDPKIFFGDDWKKYVDGDYFKRKDYRVLFSDVKAEESEGDIHFLAYFPLILTYNISTKT